MKTIKTCFVHSVIYSPYVNEDVFKNMNYLAFERSKRWKMLAEVLLSVC